MKYTEEALKNDLRHVRVPEEIAGSYWGELESSICASLKELPLTSFTQWPTIRSTMFHEASSLEYSKVLKSRFSELLAEDAIGSPLPYYLDKKTSGNLIHHFYSLIEFEEHTKINIKDVKSIYEFGGGYGSFCRAVFRAGFFGEFTILDLPALSLLQRYFLSHVLPSIEQIQFITKPILGHRPELFVALWSLSEAPEPYRDKVLDSIGSPRAFLLTYNWDSFGDNRSYFTKVKNRFSYINWIEYEIKHLPGSVYLFGEKND